MNRSERIGEGVFLIHETPRRMRLRLSILRQRKLDLSWLRMRVERLPGVRDSRINPAVRTLVVEYDGSPENRQLILDGLLEISLRSVPAGDGEVAKLAEMAPMAATTALLGSMPLMSSFTKGMFTYANISPVLWEGVETLVTRGIKMEVLDAIAVGLSAYRKDYYTANITYLLMQLGEYLETQTQRQSDNLLRGLLQPETGPAWVERDGKLIQIPADEVKVGERVVVGVGDSIPVDGLVLDGAALVNQSSITGESIPVRKEIMDKVISGTVVEEGRLKIEVRHVGEDTTTARISKFIDESLGKRSETQNMAEKLADQRVWFTLGTGAAVYLLTGDERRLESVFLVDYSCALKLAPPVAFKSGMYNAANQGILLKGGQAIEQLAEVDTIVFDKTGTLTYGDLQVEDVVVFDESRWPRERLLAVAASIEEHATHPIAEAIVRKAKEEKLNHIDHGEVEYLVAHGMSCPVNGDNLLIGSRHYLEEHEGLSFESIEKTIEQLEENGNTLLYVGTVEAPLGIIALRARLRDNAVAVITGLREMGIKKLVMLTGDRRNRAEAMAAELGLDEVFAEQPPEEKAAVIEQLQARGHKVAFVGDGVNDGPALVAAEVGIAMSRGAELARATSDIVLLEDDLALLLAAREGSQHTMQLIRTNFKMAIGINTGILLGAALGVVSPVVSAVLHNGTTIGLLLNALRGSKSDKTSLPLDQTKRADESAHT